MLKALKPLFSITVLLGLAVGQSFDKTLFPIYAGGRTGDEKVSCFLLDETNGRVIVGGNTTSYDFAPAAM